MPDDAKSRIAELERELYAKDFEAPKVGDGMRPHGAPDVPASWNAAEDAAAFEEEKTRTAQHHKLMKKFALGSLIFFVLAVGVSALIWWREANIVSGDNIAIEASAPPAVPGGESFETKLVVTNNNKVSIEMARLFLEYPVGFYSATDRSELLRISKDLGQIASGKSVTENIETIVYGEENVSKEVRIVLEYRMAGSNAVLEKKAVYAVRVSSSPINLKIEAPKESSSGQAVEFDVLVESNSKDTLSGVLATVEYPFGFTYQSASPAPVFGTNTWSINNLAPQERQTIRIRGVIEGQEGEEKIFRATIGARNVKDERVIGVAYNSSSEALRVTKPFLGLEITIDNTRTTEYSAPFGKAVRVDVAWQSNSQTKVADAVIEVKLKGDILNRYSIYASSGGFYRSADDTIVWQKMGNSELAMIDPGAHGSVSFGFSPIATGVGASRALKNPKIIIEVRATAKRGFDSPDGGEDIATFATRTVKFASDVRLTAQGLYHTGPFKNTGPLPPKADTPTTYTIKWVMKNSTNSVSDAIVKTTIPVTYVKWLGAISPSGENISYNENNGEVSWVVGRIPSGGTREAAFQISFLPSLSQLNQAPQLAGESVLTAHDDFAKTTLTAREPQITTYLQYDPSFSQNQGNVVN